MKTNIQIFTSDIFGEIRTCQVNNQIMFVGKDVATALGYAKPQNALATHVDSEDKTAASIQGSGSDYASGLYGKTLMTLMTHDTHDTHDHNAPLTIMHS